MLLGGILARPATSPQGVLYLLNLLYILYVLQNGNALPAAMGAAAKRAHRLQERRCV